ncbi:MAG TPA: efflux RND transporter periplasmic adaptor subunit [Blastocatellia bacterium]|nr:efflux RND transporter periplasmic adaptor subunit [Blastocatellia bacterium]
MALGCLYLAAFAGAVFLVRSSAVRSFVYGGGSQVEEVTVATRSMTFWVQATGTLRATSVRDFGGPPAFGDYWQFQIVSMAPEGQAVKKGDVVMRFDAQRINQDLQTFQNELDQATKEMERTRVQIDLERQDLEAKLAEAENRRDKLKLKQGLSPDVEKATVIERDALDYEQATREVAALKDRIKWHATSSEANYKIIASKKARAENKVAEIQKGIESFAIRSDRDGVLVYKTKWNGERFQVGENVWSGRPLVEIPDLNTMIAEALVPEVDIGRIRLGQRAEIAIDAFPGKAYGGTLKSVGTLVRPKSWDIPNKVLDAQIVLDQLDTSVMRPAMSIKVKIETDRLDGCIAAPLKAVLTTAEGSMVKVKTDAGWRVRAVKLGQSNGTDVVITEGLAPGERIAADYLKAK